MSKKDENQTVASLAELAKKRAAGESQTYAKWSDADIEERAAVSEADNAPAQEAASDALRSVNTARGDA